jgi:hypothetical protein
MSENISSFSRLCYDDFVQADTVFSWRPDAGRADASIVEAGRWHSGGGVKFFLGRTVIWALPAFARNVKFRCFLDSKILTNESLLSLSVPTLVEYYKTLLNNKTQQIEINLSYIKI